ncbi:MAG: alpha-L-rhamnosidase [Calditrichaeota bacterium]|nr:MAG: alpha-L-rhamnosidase [Calditrichota bacterium]
MVSIKSIINGLVLFGLFFIVSISAFAQTASINPALLQERWQAWWISHPTADPVDFGVYHYRKTITLEQVPSSFIVHVSADNRYRLYVNRQSVSTGPSRWDLPHWRFETVDLAPFLKKGENIIAAVVWNFGEHKPWAQFSWRSGFILQGDSEQESAVNSGDTWKVLKNDAYSPIPINPATMGNFVVVGPGEEIDGARYPWGWLKPEYDDRDWQKPARLEPGKPRGFRDAGTQWLLTPRQIPAMEETLQRTAVIRRSEGVQVHDGFLSGKKALEIPANTSATILLDNRVLTTAYPELLISGGKGATIKLTYAEALVDQKREKGNRNDIDGRSIWGYYDIIHPDGGANRFYVTLWFRTFRYLQLDIKTADAPLAINDFYSFYTGYPFEEKAIFESSEPALKAIWETGWRTARLCANETYFDCPYYEQLQYVGDTRIQALISLYVSGDDRLMRQAIELFNDSRTPDGLTASRYPTNVPQVIPTYSLFWVNMVHDYWMHRQDDAFVRSFLVGIQGVIDWYEQHIDAKGLLGPMPWWNFVDWPDEWAWSTVTNIGGVPAGASDGNSTIISLQFVETVMRAAELLDAFGYTQTAAHYRDLADSMKSAVQNDCWDVAAMMYADTPQKTVFSQHANVNAVLADMLPQAEAQALLKRIMSDKSLIPCTMYYQYYLFRALQKVGMADSYLEQIKSWHDMLAMGLTTFAERPEPTRSDCHAWSASPNYDFLATVCGIQPAEPGFKSVAIRPALGKLTWVKASMPHPLGEIKVELKRKGVSGIEGQITLPPGLNGTFIWNDQEINLTAAQTINLP